MAEEEVLEVWRRAASMDPTLILPSRLRERLLLKQITVKPFSRERLFARMIYGQPSLFRGVRVPIKRKRGDSVRSALVHHLKTGFPKHYRARVQRGYLRTRTYLPIPDLMIRWERGKAIFGVTDLHLRGTRFARAVDTTSLDDFNVLCEMRGPAAQLEMMTLVVSSAGNVTDSHTDDSDGSNHCFCGEKLWLMWDRLEGQARGLEDVSHDEVTDSAAFSLRTFLSLSTARWLIVSPGLTLFLPGDLAHKVVTLEPYLGLGSFHVALPGFVRSLRRWILHDPIDVTPALLREITGAVIRKMDRLNGAPDNTKRRWGYDYVPRALRVWEESEDRRSQKRLLQDETFASFVKTVANAGMK